MNSSILLSRNPLLPLVVTALAAGRLAAVELPPPADPPAPAPAPAPAAEARPAPGELAPAPAPEAMPLAGEVDAYLGVGGTEVPELLSTHLGLVAGEGVVVRTLDPDGPAASVGVDENDVLLKVGGAAVGTQDQLREAILDHRPGDEIELDLIHRGQPIRKTVKLGERPKLPGVGAQRGELLEGLPEEQAKRVREAIELNLRALEGMQAPRDPQVPEAMKQLEKRMELMFRGLGGNAGPGIQFQSSGSVRLQDAEGSVEMQTKDGSKQMRVRDNSGEIVWEGPWDTDQDKAAAPDDVRERIDRLNFGIIEDGENGGLRLQIVPGGGLGFPGGPDDADDE